MVENRKHFPGRFIGMVCGAEGYCVQCKTLRPIVDAAEVKLRNEKVVISGSCAVCGTQIYKTRS